MAIKKTIDIDINTNADEAAKEFDKFGKAVNTADKSVTDLNKTFEQVYGEMQPLTTRMGEAEDRLYELAAAGDTTSKEYQGLLQKVGEYRQVQIKTDLAVDGAAKTLSQKLGGALTGAASGYALVQGTMALFGTENEALEKSLLKVQSALAIQQGVQGLSDAYKELGIGTKLAAVAQKIFGTSATTSAAATTGSATATTGASVAQTIYTGVVGTSTGALKLFKLALLATGIGAFIVLLGVAADAMGFFGDSTDEAAKAQERLSKSNLRLSENFKRQQKLLEESNAASKKSGEFRIEQMRLQGASEKEIFEQQQRNLKSHLSSLAKLDEAALKEFKRFTESDDVTDAEKYDAAEKELYKYNSQINDANRELQLLELGREKELSDKRKEQNKQRIADAKVTAAELKRIAAELARAQKEALDQEIAEEIELQQTFDEIQRENEDRFRTEQENELLLVEEKYDTLQAMAQGNADALNEIDIARLNELNDVKLKFADKEVVIEEDKNIDIEELRAKNIKFALDSAREGLAILGDFAQQSADKFNNLNQQVLANEELTDKQKQKMLEENNKKAKRAFDIQKAASIAATLISTYQSAQSAYLSQFLPLPDPSSPVRGAIAAGLAGVAGLANVAKIASQKFEGASIQEPSTGGGSVPNIGGGSAPNFNVVGDSGVNQLATLQTQPTMAYVVSGEVTTAQALDRNRVQNATL